jgi:diguanylate cyclase (GGDEF)-like protein/putative nucleotidyltransferase with HDIG domain
MKDLSIKTRIFVNITILAGVVLLVLNLLQIDWGGITAILILGAVSSLTLILKVEGATERSHYNVSFLIYAFTFVLLGPEAAIPVILISNLADWLWHKYPWYIQSFNLSTYIIAIFLSGRVNNWVYPDQPLLSLSGVISILAAMGTFTLLNHLMIGLVIWMARGEDFKESGIFSFFSLMLDFTLLCMGVGTAIIWEATPFGVILILLPLYMIYSTLKVPSLERKSETDSKTGLFNAAYFNQTFEKELERANRFDRPLTIVMGDMDLLRNINNTYGHIAGDEVLIGVSNILRDSVREFDVVARFGGEEFSILMPETTPEQIYSRIDHIRKVIEETGFDVPTSVTPIHATMSFGIAERLDTQQTPKDIIHNADTALYHAKLKGRNGTYIYSEDGINELFNPDQVFSSTLEEIGYQQSLQVDKSSASKTKVVEHVDDDVKLPNEEPITDQGEDSKAGRVEKYPQLLVHGYVLLIAAAATLLFLNIYDQTLSVDWIGIAVFVLMIVITEWFAIEIYVRNTSVSTSAVPMLAGILIYGPVGALMLSFTFAAVALVKHRSPLNRFVFNFSNQMVAGMLYLSAVSWPDLGFLEMYPAIQFVVCLAAMGVVYISTTTLIAIGMSLDQGFAIKDIWREHFGWLAYSYLGMGVIAYVLIYTYQVAGLMGTLIFFVPLLILRLGQKQYVERTKDHVQQLRDNNLQLERISDQVQNLNEGLLNTLAEVVDLRDPYVLGHSKQVSHYASLIAKRLGLSKERIEFVRQAGLLHDIGKLGISERLLLKPESLSPNEYNIIKEHVVLGADILEATNALQDLIPIIRHHHERFDGNGYPDGLVGHSIPVEARILAVADAVEAMGSDRPYRRALKQEEIIEELRVESGKQFDPMLVKVFIEILEGVERPIVVNSALNIESASRATQVLMKTSGALD